MMSSGDKYVFRMGQLHKMCMRKLEKEKFSYINYIIIIIRKSTSAKFPAMVYVINLLLLNIFSLGVMFIIILHVSLCAI